MDGAGHEVSLPATDNEQQRQQAQFGGADLLHCQPNPVYGTL